MEYFKQAVDMVERAVAAKEVPSAALGIGVGDRVLVERAFGVTSYTEEATPVDTHTLYDMASMTKIMGPTMIALRMIARGELDLCDMLPRFFGDAVPEDKREITIFHLMTHTSGIPAVIRLDQLAGSRENVVPCILRTPLHRAPGTKVEYSCMGYILLGKILERIGGKRLDQLAREEVFTPLGLTHTSYHPLDEPISRENTVFTERSIFDGEWLCGKVHDENAYFQNGVSGNAGIFSCLTDVIRYARMLAGHGALDGVEYLPRRLFDTAIRDYTPGQDVHRGLGFHLAGGYDSYSGLFFDQKAFGHTGFTGTHLLVSPESGLFVTLLTNRVHPDRSNPSPLRLRRTLHTVVQLEYDRLHAAGAL